jgi:hypothetical protein
MAKSFRRISLRYEKMAVTYRASISIDTAPHIHQKQTYNLDPAGRKHTTTTPPLDNHINETDKRRSLLIHFVLVSIC